MAKLVLNECYKCAGKTLKQHRAKFKGRVMACVTGYCDACDTVVGYASELYPREFRIENGFHYYMKTNKHGEVVYISLRERNLYG